MPHWALCSSLEETGEKTSECKQRGNMKSNGEYTLDWVILEGFLEEAAFNGKGQKRL